MNKNFSLIVLLLCAGFTNLSHSASVPISLFAKIGWSFGTGSSVGAFFGPVTFAGGLAIGGIVHLLKEKKVDNDAQAPGIPTEKDGFIPPKKWDGKKCRHPLNGKVGYPDKKGNIWVPTGPGPLAHGGPHWDVQTPSGRSKNIYPGGRVR